MTSASERPAAPKRVLRRKGGVSGWQEYDHARFAWRRKALLGLLRYALWPLLAKLDSVEGVENVPAHGPVILLINHIAFIDPIVVMHVLPRQIVPMAKIEVYDYPVIGIFPYLWGVIPVRRGEVDRRALRMAIQVLQAGEIVLLAPEGTRSPALQRGKEGIAFIASRTGAPVVPVALEGTEGFPALRGTRRWRGPGVQVRFGAPFRFREDLFEKRPSRQQLRQMTDDAMCVLARMLPPHRRGVYADQIDRPLETIRPLSAAELGG
ncbi:MAG TPA: 1-acyl-sn-glycerol-3-phosphate acyltransferase [Chloroflexi bacterium]|nr:1-acyl-sn-glycerol-3-phosphate acyltransferase [Chloroflexota bacterium]